MKNKKGEFKFSNYFVFMFLVIALLGVFGGITASMMVNYEVNTTPEFETYINSFDMEAYANDNVLGIDSSDSGSGAFSEYESSFKFFDQAKTTQNQTKLFVKSSVEILGLPTAVWGIIIGVVIILFLIAGAMFLRGIKE